MSEAQFKYKCRQCGEVFGGPLTAVERATSCLIVATTQPPAAKAGWGSKNPTLFEIHNCSLREPGPIAGNGIADLIGYEVRE